MNRYRCVGGPFHGKEWYAPENAVYRIMMEDGHYYYTRFTMHIDFETTIILYGWIWHTTENDLLDSRENVTDAERAETLNLVLKNLAGKANG